MANIKSQLKRIKTNEKARLRNKAVKSSLKTSVRKFREAADAGDRDLRTSPPNVFALDVQHIDGRGWCVTTTIDGRRHVVSTHADEEQARDAASVLNGTAQPPGPPPRPGGGPQR